ncbi:MAG: response regulator transcription factor [Cyanobacteria bacterium P01_H01_bin.121]
MQAKAPPRILLVDDQPEMTEPLSRVLQQEGYTVEVVATGQQGHDLARSQAYDLLILDWMLPQRSGLEICQQLRTAGVTTPVLFLTAKDTLDDRVLGLDAGADDYLIKPFELRELLARVRALLRRNAAPHESSMVAGASERLSLGDLQLDPTNQVAYRRSRAIALSDKESQLLQLFLQHPGELLTHQQLIKAIWGEVQAPHSNVLAAQIRLLRRKIEGQGEPMLLHTVYGRGYRFGPLREA